MKRLSHTLQKLPVLPSILVLLFLSGVILGVLAYPLLKEQTVKLAEELKKLILADDKPITAVNIFLKNLQASLLTLMLGPTILLPLLIVFSNGFATGLMIHLAYEKGKSIPRILIALTPHGVPELAAFFLAASGGMNTGLAFLFPNKKPRLTAAIKAGKKAILLYFTVVLPLLILAAILETYVSTQLIQ